MASIEAISVVFAAVFQRGEAHLGSASEALPETD